MTKENNNETSFLQFAIEAGVLRFGEFTLKSGRMSPYFFDTGLFKSGETLSKLAYHYAKNLNIKESGSFMLFGPAYKGIPLATATSIELARHFNRNIEFSFNRKEIKDHGEGGQLIGAELKGNVIIIDDVITAGTSIIESIDIIKRSEANAKSVIIALDRQEAINENNESAIDVIQNKYDITVNALARFSTLLKFIETQPGLYQHATSLKEYQEKYGCKLK